MARTIDFVERVSESFDALAEATKGDMVAELFSRLEPEVKAVTLQRLEFHCKLLTQREALQGMEPLS